MQCRALAGKRQCPTEARGKYTSKLTNGVQVTLPLCAEHSKGLTLHRSLRGVVARIWKTEVYPKLNRE